MTTSEKAKSFGYRSLKQFAALCELTPQTLRNMHKRHPARFQALLIGFKK